MVRVAGGEYDFYSCTISVSIISISISGTEGDSWELAFSLRF
jgi:hypothetical protein